MQILEFQTRFIDASNLRREILLADRAAAAAERAAAAAEREQAERLATWLSPNSLGFSVNLL